jgi:hypothetical protein
MGAGCRSILNRSAMSLAISPDGRHLALVAMEGRGPVVELMDLEGGQLKELTETATACEAAWASATTLWVSRRRGGKIVWIEINCGIRSRDGAGRSGIGRLCRRQTRSPVTGSAGSESRLRADLAAQAFAQGIPGSALIACTTTFRSARLYAGPTGEKLHGPR